MKVYELFVEMLKHVCLEDKERLISELVELSLEEIKSKIVRTQSIDEMVKLKQLHNDLLSLKCVTWKLDKILDKDMRDTFKSIYHL